MYNIGVALLAVNSKSFRRPVGLEGGGVVEGNHCTISKVTPIIRMPLDIATNINISINVIIIIIISIIIITDIIISVRLFDLMNTLVDCHRVQIRFDALVKIGQNYTAFLSSSPLIIHCFALSIPSCLSSPHLTKFGPIIRSWFPFGCFLGKSIPTPVSPLIPDNTPHTQVSGGRKDEEKGTKRRLSFVKYIVQ